MEISTRVIANDRKGKLVWKDNPWKLPNGEDADILVKVKFDEKNTEFFRLSELIIDTEVIEETKQIMQK